MSNNMMSSDDVSEVLYQLFCNNYDFDNYTLISREFIADKYLDKTNFFTNNGLIFIDLIRGRVAVYRLDRFHFNHLLIYQSVTPVKLMSKVIRHTLEGKKWITIPPYTEHPIYNESFGYYDEIYGKRN